eukprot:gb/GECG01005498.1/.p1 GENE.gb/GECG01005498.1/~~gb/GECG01005498.1/.p1  ORF type:complete len:793 (+),score=153.92 gb/GECG01005498.1/:1-2379(+)
MSAPSTIQWGGNVSHSSREELNQHSSQLNGPSSSSGMNSSYSRSSRHPSASQDHSTTNGDVSKPADQDLSHRVQELEQQRQELLGEIHDLEYDLSTAHKNVAPKQNVLANSCAVNFKALKQMRAYNNALEKIAERMQPHEDEEEELAERADAAHTALQGAFIQQAQLQQALTEMQEGELLKQATRDPTADGTEESLLTFGQELTGELQNRIDALQEELDATKKEKLDGESRLKKLEDELRQTQTALDNERNKIGEEEAHSRQTESELRSSLESSKKRIQELQDHNKQLQEDNNALNERLEEQNRQIEENDQKYEKLKQSLEDTRKDLEERDTQIADKDREIQELSHHREQEDSLSSRVHSLEQQLHESEQAKSSLQKENKKLKNKLSDFRVAVDRRDEELEQLRNKLDQTSRNWDSSSNDNIADYVAMIDEMRNRLAELEVRQVGSGRSFQESPSAMDLSYPRSEADWWRRDRPLTPGSSRNRIYTLENSLQNLRNEIQPPPTSHSPGNHPRPSYARDSYFENPGDNQHDLMEHVQNLKQQLLEQEERMRQVQAEKEEMSERAKTALHDVESQVQQLAAANQGQQRFVSSSYPYSYQEEAEQLDSSYGPRRSSSRSRSARGVSPSPTRGASPHASPRAIQHRSHSFQNVYDEPDNMLQQNDSRFTREELQHSDHRRRGSFDSVSSASRRGVEVADGPDTSTLGPLSGSSMRPRIMRKNPSDKPVNQRRSTQQDRNPSGKSQPVKVRSTGSDAAAAAAKSAREAAERASTLSNRYHAAASARRHSVHAVDNRS